MIDIRILFFEIVIFISVSHVSWLAVTPSALQHWGQKLPQTLIEKATSHSGVSSVSSRAVSSPQHKALCFCRGENTGVPLRWPLVLSQRLVNASIIGTEMTSADNREISERLGE